MIESAKIIHVDMDCFYAQVEMRDDPQLKGKPVIISGPPNSRSVVCTASYEAREYGVRSAISAAKAYKLCPKGVFIPPNFAKYKEVSRKIHGIFSRYTDKIEPLSLDEAYLDLTSEDEPVSATLIAYEIQKAIYDEIGLTCSIGVSYNKLLAKIGSDFKKPGGITIIEPHKAQKFINKLPIQAFPGVGRKSLSKFHEYGIYTGHDFRKLSFKQAQLLYGRLGSSLYFYTRGVDNREVISERIAKSIGCEYTMANDLQTKDEINYELKKIANECYRRVEKSQKCFKTISLKLKFNDFTQITRAKSLNYYEYNEQILFDVTSELLKTVNLQNDVRLVGITVSNLRDLSELEKQVKIIQIPLDI